MAFPALFLGPIGWQALAAIASVLGKSKLLEKAPEVALKIINTLSAIFRRGGDGDEAFRVALEHIKKMEAEGRIPTEEEWAALDARLDSASQRLQAP